MLVWALPARLKPYQIRRDFDDYKILFVEHSYELGFAENGIVDVHIHQAYGGTRAALVSVRQDWIDHGSRSKKRWPVSSLRPHYDEWGPIHYVRDDGVEVTQTGVTACVPYSIFALIFCAGLVVSFLWKKRRTSNVEL
jgi:hypothetical protein